MTLNVSLLGLEVKSESTVSVSYLAHIDTVVDRPGCLEAFHHALLKGLGQPVHPDEVLQVLCAGVVEGAPRVHPLDDGGHVTEHHGMHQCLGEDRR